MGIRNIQIRRGPSGPPESFDIPTLPIGSDDVFNQSVVPGSNVSDALDFLLAGVTGAILPLSRYLWLDPGTVVPGVQDGSIAHPFATLAQALALVDTTDSWGINFTSGFVTENVAILAGATVALIGNVRDQSGQQGTLTIGDGASLYVYSMSVGDVVMVQDSSLRLVNGSAETVDTSGGGSPADVTLQGQSVISAGDLDLSGLPGSVVEMFDASVATDILCGTLRSFDSFCDNVTLTGATLEVYDGGIGNIAAPNATIRIVNSTLPSAFNCTGLIFRGDLLSFPQVPGKFLDCSSEVHLTQCEVEGDGTHEIETLDLFVDNYTLRFLIDQGTVLTVNLLIRSDNVDPAFKAEFFIDPTFVGTQTGSSSSPFTQINSAFVVAALLGLTGARIVTPSEVTIVENVVFPDGGDWEIACAGEGRTNITGTVDVTTVAQGIRRLTGLIVSGAVTGASTAASSFFFLNNTVLSSTCSLSAVGAGYWRIVGQGLGTTAFALGGAISGALTLAGELFADQYSFSSSPDVWNMTCTECAFAGASITLRDSVRQCILRDCVFAAPLTITGVGGTGTCAFDGFSMAKLMSVGLTLVSAVMVSASNNLGVAGSITGNVAATALNGSAGAHQPEGLYEAIATLDQSVAGTSGLAVVNVIFTNLGGVGVTLPVTAGLNVAAGAGQTDRGPAIPFSHNGSTSIQYSVTGVVTAGAWSAKLKIVVRRVD